MVSRLKALAMVLALVVACSLTPAVVMASA